MADFDLKKYLVRGASEEERSPSDTVLEYVTAFQKWARDCHHWAKQNRQEVSLLDKTAREILAQIQKKYCTSKSRLYERSSSGYFFYGGTADVYPQELREEKTDVRSYHIITPRKKPHHPSFRFTLERQGGVWLIANLERLNGRGVWEQDNL